MARSCGIRLGPRRYELVVLDGNAKKHKITAYSAGELPQDGEGARAEVIDILKDAVKKHRVPREAVYLAVDTGNAAFRHLSLPFADRQKIAQVVKFEVESQLPQWNIDDVVVDFQILSGGGDSSELLVSAIPKAQLGPVIELCERAGFEPLDAELETSAMVNAAAAAELCPPEQAVLLVHVGEYSTSVVVIDGGAMKDMRVIHLGGLSHESLLARPKGAEEGEPAGEKPEGEGEELADAFDPVEVGRRIDQAIKRLRRELGRTISAASTTNPLSAIYLCGIELPGFVGSSVLDIEIKALDCFEQDGGQPAEGFSALVVAYGSALRGMGPVAYPASLRREELRYTGAVERIEFPLAVAALLLCFLLGVVRILQFRESEMLRDNAWYWALTGVNYLVGEPAQGAEGNLPLGAVPKPFADYLKRVKDARGDDTRSPLEMLQYTSGELVKAVTGLRSELGQDGEIAQPQSAYAGLCLVLGVLDNNAEKWRPSLRQIVAEYQTSTAQKPERVQVQLGIVFFADNSTIASSNLNEFEDELRNQPWVLSVEHSSTETIEGDAGVNVQGLKIEVDLAKYFASTRKLASAEPKQ